MVALTQGSSRAANQHRNKLREAGALYIVPTLMGTEAFKPRGLQRLCLRAVLNLAQDVARNAERLRAMGGPLAISVLMARAEEAQDQELLGEAAAALEAIEAKRVELQKDDVRLKETTSFGGTLTGSLVSTTASTTGSTIGSTASATDRESESRPESEAGESNV
jgi:hypothetical protein